MQDSGYKPQLMTLPRLAILGAVLLLVILGITWWQWGGEEDAPAARAVQKTAAPAVAAAGLAAPASVVVEQAQPSTAPEAVVAENAERPTSPQSPVAEETAPVSPSTSSILRQPMQAIGTLNPLLRTRSIAMQDWLVETDPDAHTVQLLSVASTDSAYVARILNRLDQAGLIDKSYACISNSQGQDYWKVVYGDFATIEQARNIIYGLPSSVRNNGPYVQSVRKLDCNVAMDLN